MTNPLRLSLAAALLAALLAGCSSPTYMRSASTTTTGAEHRQQEISALLDEAARSQPVRAAELRTEAARLLIRDNRRDEAIRILEQIDTSRLPPILRFDIARLKAGTALEQQDSQQALLYLAEMPSSEPLPTAQAIELGELRARAYQQQHDTLGELRELIQVAQLQQDRDARQALHERIWALLGDIPTAGLEELVRGSGGSYYEQGWYELAYDLRTSTDLATQHNALNDWQLLWQSHPAMLQPPSQVAALLGTGYAPAGRIGLLLPQSGPAARAASAISDGFMAAYFEAQRDGMPVPEVQLLDSTLINTPEQLFDLTRTMQLDMVIGPLDKGFVTALGLSPSVPVPILALNNTDIPGPIPRHFYQLALAPEDEGEAAALRAWQDGHRRMLMMIPETEWGTRVGQAFLRKFERLGGVVVGAVSFAEQSDLAPQVSSLLNTDSSAARAAQVQQVIGNDVEFQKQPRGDADALFLSAMPVDARQIKPLLDYNYAQDLPVYATSHIYSGSPNSISDTDLNNVMFCDLPWVLGPADELKLSMSQERDDTDSRFGRLYALGVDAYRLHPYLDQLEASPMARINGETGELYLKDGSRIGRELLWAQFKNGVPQPLQPTSY